METKKLTMHNNEFNIGNEDFSKIPQETPKNHSMVGLKHEFTQDKALLNPHNYRLYFSFEKINFMPIQGMVGVWFSSLKNYNKEFTATNKKVRITVKKNQVEVINKLTEQEWFAISRSGKAKEEIAQVMDKIDKSCVAELMEFIALFGGKSDYIILKRECRGLFLNLGTKGDFKVMHEPYIDNLPKEMTFETSIVKKVYHDPPNAEFITALNAANHLHNSGLREFAPEIANSIDNLALSMPGKRLNDIMQNCHSLADICRRKDIGELTIEEKDVLSNWTFEKFKI